jgi:phosphoesterase RecJ-like protein
MSDAGVDAVVREIEQADRFLLVSHEHPDGDALGSLVAMRAILTQLGKDCLMYINPDEFPLPHEYRFFRLDGLVTEVPADVEQRTLVFLDCGNIDRTPAEMLKRDDAHILNIDHHHDNTRFGTVNVVDASASCTAEILWKLMTPLGARMTPAIADALYVGLVTDTGRFMYENTGTAAHLMAAQLIEAGVDVHNVYRRIYEGTPYPKLELLGRGLANVKRFDDGRLTFAHLSRDDFRLAGAEESHSEGVIDHLRAVAGTKVAALAKDLLADGGSGRKKVSLRSADGDVDVSAIARAAGGGGHRQAAGFTTDLSDEQLVAFLREQVAAQL